jgi:hypothetical protein
MYVDKDTAEDLHKKICKRKGKPYVPSPAKSMKKDSKPAKPASKRQKKSVDDDDDE